MRPIVTTTTPNPILATIATMDLESPSPSPSGFPLESESGSPLSRPYLLLSRLPSSLSTTIPTVSIRPSTYPSQSESEFSGEPLQAIEVVVRLYLLYPLYPSSRRGRCRRCRGRLRRRPRLPPRPYQDRALLRRRAARICHGRRQIRSGRRGRGGPTVATQ